MFTKETEDDQKVSKLIGRGKAISAWPWKYRRANSWRVCQAETFF